MRIRIIVSANFFARMGVLGLESPCFCAVGDGFLKLKGDKSLRSSPLLSKGEVCETAGFWTVKTAQLAGTGPLPAQKVLGK